MSRHQGVQIPRLAQARTPGTPSVGRIDVDLPSDVRAVTQVSQQIENLGEQGLKILTGIEDDTIYDRGTAQVNEQDKWQRIKLNGDSKAGTLGLIHEKNDPTEAYQNFDKEREAKFNEIVARNSNLSEPHQKQIRDRLEKNFNNFTNKRINAYGDQYDKYSSGESEAIIIGSKRDAMESGGQVIPDDQTSLKPFEIDLTEIRMNRLRQGLKDKSVIEDPNGPITYVDPEGRKRQVKATPQMSQTIMDDMNDATFDTIKNLINANQTSKARFMLKEYSRKRILFPKSIARLEKLLEAENADTEAFKFMAKMQGKTSVQQQQIVRGIKDQRVRQRTSEFLDGRNRRIENADRRRSNSAYSAAMKKILAREAAGQPYDSIFELENEPAMKDTLQGVSNPVQLKAIRDAIIAPKGESNPEALDDIANFYARESFRNLPHEELRQKQAGLSSFHRKMYERLWNRDNSTETISQGFSNMRNSRKELIRRAESVKILTGRRGRRGKKLKRDMIIEHELYDELDRQIEDNPELMKEPDRRNDLINKILINKRREIDSKRSGGFFDFLGNIFSGGTSPTRKQLDDQEEADLEAKGRGKTDDGNFRITDLSEKDLGQLDDDYQKKFGQQGNAEQLRRFHLDRRNSR